MRGGQRSSLQIAIACAWALGVVTPGARALAGVAPPKQVLIGMAPYRGAKPYVNEGLAGLDRAHRLYVVVDTPHEIYNALGSYVHVAVYRPDFTPANGARVYADEDLAGTTDARGTLVFRNVPRAPDAAVPEDGESSDRVITAVLDNGGERYVGAVTFESHLRTPSVESAHLYVYTDRGIYRPGQTIFVRAIAWRLRGDFEPIAGEKIELNLVDARGIVRGAGAFVTTAYGTGSFELPLPASMPVGSYDLAVLYGGARQTTGIRVARITPPGIEIADDLPRLLSLDQQELAFAVRLSAFAGVPPRVGRLAVRVEYAGRSFFDDARPLDGSGSYDFTIPAQQLAALKQSAGEDATFVVVIAATDASRRTHEQRREIRLSPNPYTCVIAADKDVYVSGETAKVHVELIDLDGAPVRGREVRLKITATDSTKSRKTDAAGIATFDVPIAGDSTRVEAYLADDTRPLAEVELIAVTPKPMFSRIGVPLVKERRRVPIEVVIAPGYVPTEPYVHGDVVDNTGALVTAFLLPIAHRGDGYRARGSFVAPPWGTMLLTLFCAAKEGDGPPSPATVGMLTEGQQIAVVPDRGLKIDLDGVPASARPGQRLRISGRVRDIAGRSVNASVGASVVDAAVLSLVHRMDPLAIKPADRFYDPQLKVLATTGAKILTWPVVSRNWGTSRMDIARPPFGFQEGMAESPEDCAVGSTAAKAAVGGAESGTATEMDGGALAQTSAPGVAGDSGDHDAKPVTITMRTRFPETTLWIDELEAQDGRFRFEVTLPHAITRQAITVVASDSHGGIGMLRADLPVSQPIFARSFAPRSLRMGGTVDVGATVRNLGDAPVTATLSLHSDSLDVADEATRSLIVAPHSAVGAAFRVTPEHLGEIAYDVVAQGAGFRDTEQRELVVLPAGTPVLDTFTGESSREQPFALDLDAGAKGTTTATVSVVLPGAGRLVREYLELLRGTGALNDLGVDPFLEMPGSRAALAFQLLRFFSAYGAATEAMAVQMRRAVAEDLVLIAISSDDNGGQRFLRTGEVSPYLTGCALEGLVAARQMQFPVPDAALADAGGAILRSLDERGSVFAADIGWWEGDAQERRMGLTADLFRILAEAGPVAVPVANASEFAAMRDHVGRFVMLTTDPLTLGNAGLGALYYAINFGTEQLDGRVARRYVRRIIEARHDGHWEPSWFKAAGGTVKATAIAIELLQYFDPQQAAPVIREASHALLEAGKLFGGWHNPAATIATVRALNALPRTPDEPQQVNITIAVNGITTTSVTIDPSDPFGSALGASLVDITKSLDAGSNHVEVRYTGISVPFISVERRRYVERGPNTNIDVVRHVEPMRAAPGQRVRISLDLDAKVGRGPVAIEEALPINVEVIRESLDELEQRRVIADYQLGSRLVLYLPKLVGKQRITYGVRAVRPGESSIPPPTLRPLGRPEQTVVCGESTRLVVE